MKDIRLIIFDFDGTLADTGSAIKQAFWGALNEMNLAFTKPLSFQELSCLTLKDMFRALGLRDPKSLSVAEEIYQRNYRDISARKVNLFPGVPETLEWLKACGFDLAIATNEHRRNLDHLLSATGISGSFLHTVCENEVTRTKPDPEMAQGIMAALNTQPEQTLIVGDSVLDMQMGKQAGAFTCGAAYGTHSEEKLEACGADWMIREIEALPDLLYAPRLDRIVESNGSSC